MIELQIDGRTVAVREGSMVMDAATALGIYVPHFCYHRKLSIAANCRMCLVDIEKSPKPMPACATPVLPGMIVRTASPRAQQAQRAVMEFLLINHPLDCPICDQGGECQLQDLAVGYGGSAARYREEKRVVLQKNLGPLVAAQEMARCIHCTRCVRFGQEIAGVMELGMAGHGEHAEILPFVGRTVDSELSGNMIDVCPVGALTSKPFRYRARTWELARRRSVSPHDSLGSNLVLQVKFDTVERVLPLDNEAVNECWLSDRDRFSYEGLQAPDRLTQPLLRRDGRLLPVSWSEALDASAALLRHLLRRHGAAALGALAAPWSSCEELYLLSQLMRGLGSENIDFRLRQADFTEDADRSAVPWLGMSVAELGALDRVLLVGSSLRQDHPLLAVRLRRAVAAGGRLCLVHGVDLDPLMSVAAKAIMRPAHWPQFLAQIAAAVARCRGLVAPPAAVEPTAPAWAIAEELCSGSRVGLLAGNTAAQHPQAAVIRSWLRWIAQALGARSGVIGEAANSVGGYLVGALPGAGGRNARSMWEQPLPGYLLWGIEPQLDCADPAAARTALANAEVVIAAASFQSPFLAAAQVVLPIAAFAENSGSFVNTEGRLQSYNGAVAPPGAARPGWKVLRVLGNALDLPGFDYASPEEVRAHALPATPRYGLEAQPSAALTAAASGSPPPGVVDGRRDHAAAMSGGVEAAAAAERLAEVPLYAVDPLVRRASALQQTVAARPPCVSANAATLARFGVAAGTSVRVRQGPANSVLPCVLDAQLPDGVVRVCAGRVETATLGPMFGAIELECV